MKWHPILMSASMVLSTLDDRKTKTRRVVVDRNSDGNFKASELDLSRAWVDGQKLKSYLTPSVAEWNGHAPDDVVERLYCRYSLGDRLWVRETLRLDDENNWRYDADGKPLAAMDEHDPRASAMLSWVYHNPRDYCPSIHMPRWASRLTLEVTDVRVERLQEITGDDVIAEGVDFPSATECTPDALAARWSPFRTLWNSLNASRGFGWDKNPWVWVIGFRRVV